MKQKFIEFLKSEGAWESFQERLANSDRTDYPLDEYLEDCYPEEYLDRAFSLYYPDRRYGYWWELDKKWQKICEEYNH